MLIAIPQERFTSSRKAISMKTITGVLAMTSLLLLGGCLEEDSTSPKIDSASNEIIGGEATPDGLFPATGGLLFEGDVYCTGTLVAPRVVLTAAHCLDAAFIGDELPSFTLKSDAHASRDGIAGARTIPHPKFDLDADAASGLRQVFDIGVLVLSEPIESVPFERLPSREEAASLLTNDVAVEIVGYGVTDEDTETAGIKHHGSASLGEAGEYEIVIANTKGQQNCFGDSGGPSLVGGADARRMVGIVSRTHGDAPGCTNGSIHTRVDPYLGWIRSAAPEICEGIVCDDTPPISEAPSTDESGGCSLGGSSGSSRPLVLLLFGLFLAARRPSKRTLTTSPERK